MNRTQNSWGKPKDCFLYSKQHLTSPQKLCCRDCCQSVQWPLQNNDLEVTGRRGNSNFPTAKRTKTDPRLKSRVDTSSQCLHCCFRWNGNNHPETAKSSRIAEGRVSKDTSQPATYSVWHWIALHVTWTWWGWDAPSKGFPLGEGEVVCLGGNRFYKLLFSYSLIFCMMWKDIHLLG